MPTRTPHRETGSSNQDRGHQRRRTRRTRLPSDFTYISGWVKYTMFLFNFLFWLLGALLVAIGIYAVFDKWTSGEGFRFENIFDVIFNLAFLFIIIGGIVFIVSFAGCIGALRENMCLLKFYSLCLLMFFLCEMALAALGFIFPTKVEGFLSGTLKDELIKNYRDDLDFQNLIDQVQKDFKCCGISNDGYMDWTLNAYFNCTKIKEDNPSVERCGVPFSCCCPTQNCDPDGEEFELMNRMCGFDIQSQVEKEAGKKIYTKGCIPTIKGLLDNNLYLIGGITLGVALMQLLVIWLSRTLEGQIENQRALWRRNY